METAVSAATEILTNILLGTVSLSMLSWILVAVQTFFNDRKSEKRAQEKEMRDQERERRDIEYHLERMKELKK